MLSRNTRAEAITAARASTTLPVTVTGGGSVPRSMIPRAAGCPGANGLALKLGIGSVADGVAAGPTWSENAGGPGGRSSAKVPSLAEIWGTAIDVPAASTAETWAPASRPVPLICRVPVTCVSDAFAGSTRSSEGLLTATGPSGRATGALEGATRTS